jgi:23S rRNA-/tRNA-specific pseudouridylate synthase
VYSICEEEHLAWRGNLSAGNPHMLLNRHALHCASLNFVHPATGCPLEIAASMPSDMAELIGKLKNGK